MLIGLTKPGPPLAAYGPPVRCYGQATGAAPTLIARPGLTLGTPACRLHRRRGSSRRSAG